MCHHPSALIHSSSCLSSHVLARPRLAQPHRHSFSFFYPSIPSLFPFPSSSFPRQHHQSFPTRSLSPYSTRIRSGLTKSAAPPLALLCAKGSPSLFFPPQDISRNVAQALQTTTEPAKASEAEPEPRPLPMPSLQWPPIGAWIKRPLAVEPLYL